MNFFSLSLPMGSFAGIPVRIHFTFFIYACYRLMEAGDYLFGLTFIIGLYLSILLHEFGHALAARWCDGDAREIILWPLGGLAVCRPVFNPTAHLITSAAGPFVSLMLFAGFFLVNWADLRFLEHVPYLRELMEDMMVINGVLLLFNLIPAFPMDGGRILRDILWRWLGVERATKIAVGLSKVISICGIAYGLYLHWYLQHPNGIWLAVVSVFIFLQSSAELMALEWEGAVQPFSIRDRLKRGERRERFNESLARMEQEILSEPFHRCVVCGKSERDSETLVFRVASDGHEYCAEHLPSRPK